MSINILQNITINGGRRSKSKIVKMSDNNEVEENDSADEENDVFVDENVDFYMDSRLAKLYEKDECPSSFSYSSSEEVIDDRCADFVMDSRLAKLYGTDECACFSDDDDERNNHKPLVFKPIAKDVPPYYEIIYRTSNAVVSNIPQSDENIPDSSNVDYETNNVETQNEFLSNNQISSTSSLSTCKCQKYSSEKQELDKKLTRLRSSSQPPEVLKLFDGYDVAEEDVLPFINRNLETWKLSPLNNEKDHNILKRLSSIDINQNEKSQIEFSNHSAKKRKLNNTVSNESDSNNTESELITNSTVIHITQERNESNKKTAEIKPNSQAYQNKEENLKSTSQIKSVNLDDLILNSSKNGIDGGNAIETHYSEDEFNENNRISQHAKTLSAKKRGYNQEPKELISPKINSVVANDLKKYKRNTTNSYTVIREKPENESVKRKTDGYIKTHSVLAEINSNSSSRVQNKENSPRKINTENVAPSDLVQIYSVPSTSKEYPIIVISRSINEPLSPNNSDKENQVKKKSGGQKSFINTEEKRRKLSKDKEKFIRHSTKLDFADTSIDFTQDHSSVRHSLNESNKIVDHDENFVVQSRERVKNINPQKAKIFPELFMFVPKDCRELVDVRLKRKLARNWFKPEKSSYLKGVEARYILIEKRDANDLSNDLNKSLTSRYTRTGRVSITPRKKKDMFMETGSVKNKKSNIRKSSRVFKKPENIYIPSGKKKKKNVKTKKKPKTSNKKTEKTEDTINITEFKKSGKRRTLYSPTEWLCSQEIQNMETSTSGSSIRIRTSQ